MCFGGRSIMKSTPKIVYVFFAVLFLLALPLLGKAHRSGCHRWHSCPTNRGEHPMGEAAKASLRVHFDRRLKLEFRGATIPRMQDCDLKGTPRHPWAEPDGGPEARREPPEPIPRSVGVTGASKRASSVSVPCTCPGRA